MKRRGGGSGQHRSTSLCTCGTTCRATRLGFPAHRSAADWRFLAGLGLVASRPGGFFVACPAARHTGLEAREARRWCSRAYLQAPAAAAAAAGAPGALAAPYLLPNTPYGLQSHSYGYHGGTGYANPYQPQQQQQSLCLLQGVEGAAGEGMAAARRSSMSSAGGGGGGGHADLAAALAAAVKRRAMGSLDLPPLPPSGTGSVLCGPLGRILCRHPLAPFYG